MDKTMPLTLLQLSKNKKLTNQLEYYIEAEHYDDIRDFLLKKFNAQTLRFINDDVIYEIGDILCTLYYEDDFESCMLNLQKSVRTLINKYKENKDKARHQIERLNYEMPTSYYKLTDKQKDAIDYSEETIQTLLKELDIRENYYQYVEGFEHERYIAYSWILHQIQICLMKPV